MSVPLCESASDHCGQREREDEEEEEEISGTEIQAINSSRVGDANVPIFAVPCDMLPTRKSPPGKSDHTARAETHTAVRRRTTSDSPAPHLT